MLVGEFRNNLVPPPAPSPEDHKMNVKRTEPINLCDLQVDLDPAHWLKRPAILERLVSSLGMIEKRRLHLPAVTDAGPFPRTNLMA
jgi:hypothetical protein